MSGYESKSAKLLQAVTAGARERGAVVVTAQEALWGHESVGHKFTSAKSGASLRVVEKHDDGTMYASADGRTFNRGVWHTGDYDEHGDVWVEVWKHGTCLFHGCVDQTSRCVTQTG